jgi:hypothetical protein
MQYIDLSPDLFGQIRLVCRAATPFEVTLTCTLSIPVSADTMIAVTRVHGHSHVLTRMCLAHGRCAAMLQGRICTPQLLWDRFVLGVVSTVTSSMDDNYRVKS